MTMTPHQTAQTNHPNQTKRKLALITGASSGLGWQFAWILAQNNYDLIVTARNKTALQKLQTELTQKYGIEVIIIEQDLVREDAAKAIWQQVQLLHRSVDILINNAGFGDYGYFHKLELDRQTAMVQVNVLALLQLTYYVLPSMIEQGHGHIMNVSSLAAFQAGPFMATYYASKAFVLSFTEAIAEEIKHTNVKVNAFCPGPTNTGFVKNANLESSKVASNFDADPHQTALYGYQMMMKGKVIAIPGRQNRMLAVISKFSPRDLTRKAMYQMQRKRNQERVDDIK